MGRKKKSVALAKVDPRVSVMADYVREHPDALLHKDAHIFEHLTPLQQDYLVALNKWGNQREAKVRAGVTGLTTLSIWRKKPDFAHLEQMVKTQGGILGKHMLENLQFAAVMTVRDLLGSDKDTVKVAAAKTILQGAKPLLQPGRTLILNMPQGWAASDIVEGEAKEVAVADG